MNNSRGFTIVELITVMIIITIVGVAAFARLSDTQSFDLKAYQDQLISSLRTVQASAMQDTRANICYQLNFTNYDPSAGVTASGFGTPTNDFTIANATNTCATTIDASASPDLSTTATELPERSIKLNAEDGLGNTISFVRFNAMGRPSTDGNACAPLCEITLSDIKTQSVCVNAEGFVYGC